jgi:salicylate synthetase
MTRRVTQYRGTFDALATYSRLRESGVLGTHSYLHVSPDRAEIGWAPVEHLTLTAAEFGPDWKRRIAGIAEAGARENRKAFGYVGFDTIDGMSEALPDGSGEAPPLAEFIVPGEMVTFIHKEQVTHHTSSGFDIRPYLTVRLPARRPKDHDFDLEPVSTSSAERFTDGVAAAVERMNAGEANKVVLSRFQAFELDYDPVELFAAYCLSRPFVDAFLISFGEVVAVVASPELMLSAAERRIVTNPLAGTRPRGATFAEDEALRHELKHDHKEIVEHVLSVTTMLHQLEPMCEHDTLVVGRLMEISIQQNVQHLSSVIRGTLSPECHVLDALWCLVPSVTIAGYPREAAVKMVRELEAAPRCLYSGIMGWVSGDSECRFSLAIRGIFRYGTRTYLHAGAGIVPGSVPENEFAETQHKLANAREALAWTVASEMALAAR